MKDILSIIATAATGTGTQPNAANNKPSTVGDGSNNLINNVTVIINAVIGVLGIVCVVVMIIGGINYMTSAGDAGKVKKGKDTILYGLIGLVVCVLAFALVNWVIGTMSWN